jgi:tricarballylate dehydrogenase
VMRFAYSKVEELRQITEIPEDEAKNTDWDSNTVDEFYDDLYRVTAFRTDPNLSEALITQSHAGMVWLRSQGASFVPNYGAEVLKQSGQYAYQVFDGKTKPLLNKEYSGREVTRFVGNTLEDLAAKLEGVDGQQFLKTVSAYNAAVKTDVPFSHAVRDGRCTVGIEPVKSNWANVLDTPPYEAYGVTCGITFTFGGLRINHETGQVLDLGYQGIPGLYAAGEMVGGIFYFNYPAGTGLVSGTVFGRIAGNGAGDAVQG